MEWVIRAYLLAGLIIHKLVWEWLKAPASPRRPSVRLRVVKLVKVSILAGLVLQVMVPSAWVPAPLLAAPPALLLRGIGLLLFSGGLALALAGRLQLGTNWADIEEATVLTHQRVVARGVYRHLRHPIYVGDLLLVHGLQLALNSSLVVLALALVPPTVHRAIDEERMLRARLDGYDRYCARTKRFIPFVV